MALYSQYCEIEDLKRYLRIPGVYEGSLNTEEDVSDDILLTLAIESASRVIDTFTNRQFGGLTVASAITLQPIYRDYVYSVQIPDLQDITGLSIMSDPAHTATYSTAVTDYTLLPTNAVFRGRPYTQIYFDESVPLGYESLEITAKWGWTEVPDTIKNATLLQAARFFMRRNAPFGVAGSADMGSELRLLNKLDPDVELLLKSYKRYWWVV